LLNMKAFEKAFTDAYNGKPAAITEEQANQFMRQYFASLQMKSASENIAKGQKFLDENKKKAGIKITASGLQYEVIKEGTGPIPTLEDNVTVHYTGTLIDGSVFDSSIANGKPASFPVKGVIPGWTEILQLMKTGSKYKVYIPSELAYGAQGNGRTIKPNSVLIFEMELLSVDPKPASTPAPKPRPIK